MLLPRETGTAMHGDEEWFVRRDGSMFPIDWWSAPIEIPRGRGASGRGAVFSFTDASERRAAEGALHERDVAEIRAAESRAAQRRIVERTTAVRRQVVIHQLRALYFADEGGAGLARENLAAIDDHQLIAEQDGALLVYSADAVGIAIECDAQVSARLADSLDQGC